jgi:hypothetical protein
MTPTTTKAWTFTTAQTDLALETLTSTQRMKVIYGQATCSNANTGDVSLAVGFGASTLPTVTNDSGTGATGIFMSHPGIAKGGGMVVANGGQPICLSAVGDDLRLTCSAATGGALRLVLTFWIEDTA